MKRYGGSADIDHFGDASALFAAFTAVAAPCVEQPNVSVRIALREAPIVIGEVQDAAARAGAMIVSQLLRLPQRIARDRRSLGARRTHGRARVLQDLVREIRARLVGSMARMAGRGATDVKSTIL